MPKRFSGKKHTSVFAKKSLGEVQALRIERISSKIEEHKKPTQGLFKMVCAKSLQISQHPQLNQQS